MHNSRRTVVILDTEVLCVSSTNDPQPCFDSPNQNGKMVKGACCWEKCIGAECVRSIRRERGLCVLCVGQVNI